MKKNQGITVIKLILIIIIVIAIIAIISLKYFKETSQKIDIWHKTITKQINIEEEIKENEKIIGTTDVTGEGIVINILDGNDLIHQEDLIILIDELKNSGSQAISINEQRITNTTYLYCDGAVILIDGVKIGNPFTIKAIGDKETIYGAITRNKGYIETLKKDGLKIEIEKSDTVQICKTNREDLYEYKNKKSNIEKLYLLNQISGKSDVEGKGVQILIEENSTKLTALSFLQISNDLNSAGAKAVSINGQRITNMTDMMDISSKYVLVNSIPIEGPFIINVIGNQEKIEEILSYNNSYIRKIKEKGNRVEIYNYNKIEIEKYNQKKDQNKMLVNYLK